MRIVGLSGYAQSGKDSIGHLLVEHYGFHRFAFADRMKEIALAINPIIDWYSLPGTTAGRPVRLDEIISAVGWERAKHNEEIRQMLQRIGTEAGRKYLSDDVWVKATFRQMDNPAGKYVITDVRFPNEAVAIHDQDGVLVRVSRPGIEAANTHVSESALDDWAWDYEFDNDGTLDDLAEQVADMAFDLKLAEVPA